MQAGQAPKGLLKEKMRGSGFGREIPQSGQEKCVEKTMSFPPMMLPTIMPSPSFSAASTESVRRRRMPSFTMMRSTTTSMVCFLFFASSMSSDRERTSPSTRTRT